MSIKKLLLFLYLSLVGCASFTTAIYSPDYEAVDSLKGGKLKKISVANVQPSSPDSPVNSITLRGGSLVVKDGTFSSYIQNALISDLKEAGVFDENSAVRINLTVVKNEIDVSSMNNGSGNIEIHMNISQNNRVYFEKTYTVATTFESAYAAAVAIPRGQNEYPNLIRHLFRKIYSDPDFIKAVKK